MAKGSLFVGSGSGKVGNLVLANTKQGQITKAYQPNVSNPKSTAQMLQRAKFADAVKFFKQATEGFFKFAYEDKAQNESDYNAFMRHNIKNALPMSRDLYDNVSVPALGNVFQMSAGRISSPMSLSFVTKAALVENGPKDDIVIALPAAPAASTIGAVSKVLIDAGLQAGDIITIVRVGSVVDSSNLEDLTAYDDNPQAPHWTIYQFVLNEVDTTALTDVPAIGFDVTDSKRAITLDADAKTLTVAFTADKSQWGAVVVTRKVDTGLYSNNSYLIGDTEGKAITAAVSTDAAVAIALQSWGAKGTAILKGSVAANG